MPMPTNSIGAVPDAGTTAQEGLGQTLWSVYVFTEVTDDEATLLG